MNISSKVDEFFYLFHEKYEDSVTDMVYPFVNELNIKFFSQVRVWHSGIFQTLMNESSLPRFYLEQNYPIRFSLGKNILLNSGCYLLHHLPKIYSHLELNFTREKFNLDHFVYVVDTNAQWDDLFILATTPENSVFVNLVFNNMDFIKQVLNTYKYKAKKLLEKSPKIQFSNESFVKNDSHSRYKLSTDQLNLQKILVPVNGSEIAISKQEYRCLSHLLQNHTIKKTAQIMDLSPRTVERYISNLKHKLHCQNNSELFDFIQQLYLF